MLEPHLTLFPGGDYRPSDQVDSSLSAFIDQNVSSLYGPRRRHEWPGGLYLIDRAFSSAASVSSTVSSAVVCSELSAPPALIATATAAIDTLSGASHRLNASWSPNAYQKPCSLPPTDSMYCCAAARRSSGFLMSRAHVSGV